MSRWHRVKLWRLPPAAGAKTPVEVAAAYFGGAQGASRAAA
jgi:hypothetical protein